MKARTYFHPTYFLSAVFLWGFSACAPSLLPKKTGTPEWGVQVTWHGHSCYSLKDSIGRTLVIDPFDDTVGYGQLTLRADALLITHDHFDHDYKRAVRPRLQNLELVESTGTNVVASDFYVTGIPSDHDAIGGDIHGHNRIYTFFMGGLRFAHLGDIGQERLTDLQVKLIGPVDVLFIPVGGITTINAIQAKVIVDQLKPAVIFPMHYGKIRLYPFDEVSAFTTLFTGDQLKPLNQSGIRLRKSEFENKSIVYTLTPSPRNN